MYMEKSESEQSLEIQRSETGVVKEEETQDSGIDQKAVSEIMKEIE